MTSKIQASRFFYEWKGHPISDITTFRSTLLSLRPDKPIVYLAGDSSLDNKYWVPSSGSRGKSLPVPVPEVYHAVLDEPHHAKPDIAFWLNHFLGDGATVLNLAVEESLLRDRDTSLLPHDKFIRDNIRPQDILIVSVGANDVALSPTFATMRHMLQLAWFTPRTFLEHGTAWSLNHFTKMFGEKVQTYVSRLVKLQKPRAVIVCMIYYPLEAGVGGQTSWADLQLRLLGYNRHPRQLQTAIKKMYDMATKQIQITGTKVVPCALFEVMDGKHEDDYTARVEPSVEGGRKMALHLKELLDTHVLGSPEN
jgi:hypothetical protein